MHCSATYISPIGTIILESDGQALTGLRFADEKESVTQTVSGQEDSVLPEATQWLEEYFAGKLPQHTPRLSPSGTDFQCRVWQALSIIPYGQTKTYGEIAKMVGCRSAQAVGQAISRNPIAIIIPCHRVLGSTGTLTGYAYGIDRKEYLLKLEMT